MIKIFFSAVLLSSQVFGSLIKSEDIKKNPKYYIEQKKPSSSEDYYYQALAFVYDQEIDQGFYAFLKALETCDLNPSPKICEEDQKYFTEALNTYLIDGAIDPLKTAQQLLDKYQTLAESHTEYLLLRFLISTAYGNLGIYDQFFEKFYACYPLFKDSFLAYKIQGILHIRLAQHGKTSEEREAQKKEAKKFLDLAAKKNNQDMAIFKALIFLAKEENQKNEIRKNLEEIALSEAPIPKGDLLIHVHEAVALKDYALAQQLIDKTSKLANYSRSVIAAQEYLNKKKI